MQTQTEDGTDGTKESHKFMWLKKFLKSHGVAANVVSGLSGVEELREYCLSHKLLNLTDCEGSTLSLQGAAAEALPTPGHLSPHFSYPHRHRIMPYTYERLEMSSDEIQAIEDLVQTANSNNEAASSAPEESCALHSQLRQQLDALDQARPIKLIIDTDIGSDFDDVMALLTLFNLPAEDVHLLGITTNYKPTKLRKAVAHSMMAAAGTPWTDVPVIAGSDFICGSHRQLILFGNEGKGLGLDEAEKTALWEPTNSNQATDFLYQTVKQHSGEVVICAIGMTTNIGMCQHQHADFEQHVGHIFWMGGGSVALQTSWEQPGSPPFPLPRMPHEGIRYMRGLELQGDQIV